MKKNYIVLLLIMCGMFFSAQAVDVTFQVKYTGDASNGVWLYIESYSWYWDQMTDDDNDSVYVYTLTDVEPGTQLWYNYWNGEGDEDYEIVPPESSYYDDWNRFFIVPDEDVVIPVVGFGENPEVLPVKVEVLFKVYLDPESVLPGGMWMVTKAPWHWEELNPFVGDTAYSGMFQLFQNQTVPFTFVNGGEDYWEGEETVPEECNYGTPDAPERLFEGAAADSTMPVIPFGECISTVEFTTITYRVDMSEQSMNEGDVVWAYIWNDEAWPEMSDDDEDGIYTVEINHEPGTEIYYYYAYGTDEIWDEEVVPAECSDEFGYRYFTVGDEDEELPAYVYATCEETSSVSELVNDVFTIYPNPVNNIINIEFLKNSRNSAIMLSDISGKILYQNISDGAMQMTIPVSNFANGIYILQIQSSDKTYFEKILIEN